MMKVILTQNKYKDYEKLYKQNDRERLREYTTMNNDYVQQHGMLSERVEIGSALMAMPENPADEPENPEKNK